MITTMNRLLSQAVVDPQVKFVLLTSAPQAKAFCAGGDIKAYVVVHI